MKQKIILVLRLISAGILLQTLFFKFTGAPESIYIFTQLHAEPFGRYFAGVSELIASILLLVPMTQVLGALMAIGIMLGALASHILILGLVVQDDGGLLFTLALVVLVASGAIVLLKKDEILKWPMVRKIIG
ncbi:MAG: DoxX family protein [Bdellovibrionaceae bacterium]|nr:DoxX family protein [Pseudobdellovibrionaceae bacterium]